MPGLLLAIQFLTIIPLKSKTIDENKLALSSIYFPVVGLLLGLILAGVNSLLSHIWLSPLFINVSLITLLIMITGGLHLDGLADTIDALASRKDKAEMLKIMRDSHIGTMGVLSLIIIIILKIAILSSLNPAIKNLSLILMCLLSRYSLVLTMFSFPYAREEGKAKIFIRGMNLKIFTLSSIAAFIFAFIIWRLKGILMLLIITGCTYLIGKIINRKIGGITGDTLGAINELTEVIVLLSMFFLT